MPRRKNIIKIAIDSPAAAGAGTQAKLICDYFDIKHLSTGDMLRAEINNKSDIGKTAKSFIDQGALVPDEVLLNIIDSRLSDSNVQNGYLLDGFPRTIPQAKGLNDILKNNRQKLDAVVSLTANENELIERLIKRGRDSGRSDDTPEIIKQRQEVYWKQTSPLINFYKDENLIKEIDGIGAINEIKNRILEVLSSDA